MTTNTIVAFNRGYPWSRALKMLALIMLTVMTCVQTTWSERGPYLQRGGKKLPPFFASMEKHEMMVQVMVKTSLTASPKPAGPNVKVGLNVLAQRTKVSGYEEVTDAQGRAFFLGIPSNPKVQDMISYEAWVDYQGVRFPFSVSGIPITEDKTVLYDDFDPKVRLPENRLTFTIFASQPDSNRSDYQQGTPPKLTSLTLRHEVIELQVDEDAILVNHQLVLNNQGNALIDLSALPEGGLKIPAPEGAKSPGLHNERNDLEVRGTSLYYTGALLPQSRSKISCYYTIPYKGQELIWSQTLPIPSTIGMVVTPHFKRQHHQTTFNLGLEPLVKDQGKAGLIRNNNGSIFAALGELPGLKAYQPLTFKVTDIPAPSQKGKYLLLGTIGMIFVLLLVMGKTREGEESTLSRTQLIIERDQLLKSLERLERIFTRKQITEARYRREREAITARLVTIYRALERIEALDVA